MPSPIYDSNADLSDLDAQKLITRAASQEEALKGLFTSYPGRAFSDWELYHMLGERYFITSIRRARNSLLSDGFIQVVDGLKRIGDGGVACKCWQLSQPQTELPL